jgi:ketosteroid isomerase-like protein
MRLLDRFASRRVEVDAGGLPHPTGVRREIDATVVLVLLTGRMVVTRTLEAKVSADSSPIEQIAESVHAALQTADLAGYRELLDPNVSWGAPDDVSPGCRNRNEVLAWYRRGRANGVRAAVTETVVRNDKILVGLRVNGNQAAEDAGGDLDRWQVLTVHGGRITDIRGFEDRAAAIERLG